MKKKLFSLGLALIVIYCLICPRQMAVSVTNGLTLWYHSILPTLLPFCIFSNIIIQSGIYDTIFEKMYPAFRYLYPVRSPLIYPLIAGFLFGFPLGSKICADLHQAGKITTAEAQLISCISNNFGPAFLYNYMVIGLFQGTISTFSLLLCCYLPSFILGRIMLLFNKKQDYPKSITNTYKKPTSGSQISMKILDAGIMDGFTTMLKLAGYILLSALMSDILKSIPFRNDILHCIGTGILEITNGIHSVSCLETNTLTKAIISIGIVNFGGISGILQTYAMMRNTGIRIQRYIIFKILCSLMGIGMIPFLLH